MNLSFLSLMSAFLLADKSVAKRLALMGYVWRLLFLLGID